ncbi:hypothetical protein [Flavobacterium nackdongense]|uniref:Uncharacterized protein n=1 Tax=Flavobacterium nackdongense TaxID=2547394 RepID=A0A4P6YC75_9FLAO|nr:hypothetical protein [Flavobacterium nackdongense]QBN19848.1 hypothetical protein E1750_13900 [Flavobacterium nackdongense]
MSYTDRNIVEAYSLLLEGLPSLSKIELIEKLSKSLQKDKVAKESSFFKSFGAFASEKTAEEITAAIKLSRKFKSKEIKF